MEFYQNTTISNNSVVPMISTTNLTKIFPGVRALSEVSFEVLPGEVHALVGENGAGKSTLIKTIIGAYSPDSGTISFNGNEVSFTSPLSSSKLGIEGVHQELMLIPWLSVKQNIFMNREPKIGKSNIFDLKFMESESRKLLKRFGLDIDVNKPVKRYSPSIWKMIDVARVINLNPKVIFFDEPTAILTEREVDCLFECIKFLKEKNIAIIYISHRLSEIQRIADRVTVLRDGHKIGTYSVKQVTNDEIVKLMVGRDIKAYYNRKINQTSNEIVSLHDVSLKKGQHNINLSVNAGEIVGIAGLVGSGRTEVVESLIGLNKIISGKCKIMGEECNPSSPAKMIEKKIFLLPEDRKYSGLILPFSVSANTVLSVFKRWTRFIYDKKREATESKKMIKELSIKTPSPSQLVKNLSGGNQQKVVFAKALLTESKLLILDEPTAGVDVGAKEDIHNLMDKFVNEGGAILMVSSDLPEVIGMCDRVYVMYENKIIKELDRKELSEENIAAYMLKDEEGEV